MRPPTTPVGVSYPAATIDDLTQELHDARARMYVLLSALDRGDIDCASAIVVASDVSIALSRCIELISRESRATHR